MSDFDVDDLGLDNLELPDEADSDPDTDLEASAGLADPSGTVVNMNAPPDPLDAADVQPLRFGTYDGTVEFPDGTTVTSPYQDALGNVYKGHDDYTAGANPHTVDDSGTATPST
jgi:hypothetical protein